MSTASAKRAFRRFLTVEAPDVDPAVVPELPASTPAIAEGAIATPLVPVAGGATVSVGLDGRFVTVVDGMPGPHMLVIAMLFASASISAYHQMWSPAVVVV